MQRVTLILLAALCGSAMAREVPMSPVGRELLQAAADCARSVPHCAVCRWQKFGTTTLAVCTQCAAGYVPKNGGRECWCAPGYKAVGATSAGTCVACNTVDGVNLLTGEYAYCPGAKATWVSAGLTKCGAHKLTATTTAKSEKECVAEPGYGWTAGNADAVVCTRGTYNPGYNNRACTRCPGGLTTGATADGTSATGKTSAASCVAPPGSYYYRGKAVACAKGFFKPTWENKDCTACPLGFSTSVTSGAPDATYCNVLKKGFRAQTTAAAGTAVGELCPAGTYRTTDINWAGVSTDCTSCPTGCNTNGLVGASSEAMCVTQPGYYYDPTTCTKCGLGTYNAGYNRETSCTPCGAGDMTTDAIGTVSADGCKILAGHGTTRLSDGTLSVAVCPDNTYGRPDDTYGLVDVECTKCIDNMHTTSTNSSSAADCLTNGGYGYDDGASNICDYAYYNLGNNRDPCTYCGDGQNTSTTGSTLVSQCLTARGWTGSAAGGTLKPCPKGSFKDVLDNVPCTSCNATGTVSDWGAVPRGMTTSLPYAAILTSDCDACLPGYGTGISSTTKYSADVGDTGLFTSLTNATKCGECPSGYYSAGGVTGGAFCTVCPDAYTGANMQSRLRSVTPDACIPQFPTPTTGATNMSNNAEWDIIPLADGLLVTQADATTLAACQTNCSANARCMYFNFNGTSDAGTCGFLLAPSTIAKVSGTTILTQPAAWYVLLEVKEGQYATYTVSAAGSGIGTTIGGSYTTLALAKEACDKNLACIGMTNGAKDTGADTNAQWRLFSGVKFEGAVGKVRVVGETINSWVA